MKEPHKRLFHHDIDYILKVFLEEWCLLCLVLNKLHDMWRKPFQEKERLKKVKLFFLFVSVCSSSFLSFVGCYLVSFSFLSAWHNLYFFYTVNIRTNYFTATLVFTFSTNVFEGLKAGML